MRKTFLEFLVESESAGFKFEMVEGIFKVLAELEMDNPAVIEFLDILQTVKICVISADNKDKRLDLEQLTSKLDEILKLMYPSENTMILKTKLVKYVLEPISKSTGDDIDENNIGTDSKDIFSKLINKILVKHVKSDDALDSELVKRWVNMYKPAGNDMKSLVSTRKKMKQNLYDKLKSL